ncbi:MAG TPA: ABC transporter permease [Vicinamibacterales bacterium]|jgi:predicted permease
MRKLLRRLRYLWNRRQLEADLQLEMRSHREMMDEERRVAFGSNLRLQEDSRDVWGWTWLDHLRQDLVYGAGQLRRAPGFTLAAVIVLALGVGLNLAVFHVTQAVFADRIPVPDAESLLRVVRTSPERERWSFPPEVVAFYQEHADLFTYLVGERLGGVRVQLNDDQDDARAQFVSGNYFDDLVVQPGQGRLLTEGDDRPESSLVVLLSDGYWRRRFGADPGIVSTSIKVNGIPATVVGVLPAGFTGLTMSRGELWFSAKMRARLLRINPSDALFDRPDTGIVAKVKPGVTLEAASAQLAALTVELRARQQDILGDRETVRVRPLRDDDLNQGPFYILGPLVALVLLAACANLGNMLLARGVSRQREIDTRLALGANRSRLVRQLMTESLLLAFLGSLGGLVVGRLSAILLAASFGGFLDVRISLNGTVILAAVILSLVSAVTFGLAPALQITSRKPRSTRSRQMLVAVQVTVSCVLLILAGLLTRGAQRQAVLAGGGDFSSLAVVDPGLEDVNLAGPTARQTLEGIAERVRAIPEVSDVTISADPIYGASVARPAGMPMVVQLAVDPGYFRVMGLGVLRGRLFEPNERETVVVSGLAERAAFDGGDGLGKVWNPEGGATGPTVVGLVETNTLASLRDPGAIESYRPLTDESVARAVVIARTIGDGRKVLRRLREAAALPGLSPSAWVIQTPVDQLLEHARSATKLIGVLGTAAAGLAAFGIFGLMAFSVRQRNRELAIRLALGARARRIVGALVAQYAIPFGLGMAVGVVLASIAMRLLLDESPLGLGITPLDTGGYFLGLAVFALSAIAAIVVPLRRAFRINPATALRSE